MPAVTCLKVKVDHLVLLDTPETPAAPVSRVNVLVITAGSPATDQNHWEILDITGEWGDGDWEVWGGMGTGKLGGDWEVGGGLGSWGMGTGKFGGGMGTGKLGGDWEVGGWGLGSLGGGWGLGSLGGGDGTGKLGWGVEGRDGTGGGVVMDTP